MQLVDKKFLFFINLAKNSIQNQWLNLFAKVIIKKEGAHKNSGILLIRSGGLGDFLFATPAIKALREGSKENITLITDGNETDGLYKPNEWAQIFCPSLVDEIYAWDRRSILKLFFSKNLRANVAGKHYSAVIFLSHPLEGFVSILKRIIFLRMYGVTSDSIYGHIEKGSSNIFRKYHHLWGKVKHKVDRPFEIVSLFLGKKIFLSENYRELLKDFEERPTQNCDIDNIPNIILISPESRLHFKMWPLIKYEKLIKDHFSSSDIWITGVTSEKEFSLGNLLNYPNIKDYRKKFTIKELIYLHRRAKFTLTNDGGLAHLVSMSGGKLVSIANCGEQTGVVTPIGLKTIEVRNVTTCSPCFGMSKCAQKETICVTGISVAAVSQAILKLD
jgi:ADP-heptose:LPS heptosyltransferase